MALLSYRWGRDRGRRHLVLPVGRGFGWLGSAKAPRRTLGSIPRYGWRGAHCWLRSRPGEQPWVPHPSMGGLWPTVHTATSSQRFFVDFDPPAVTGPINRSSLAATPDQSGLRVLMGLDRLGMGTTWKGASGGA